MHDRWVLRHGLFEDALEISFPERLDLLAAEIWVGVIAVVAIGVGLGLRLVGDYAVARTGGSLTGYQVGDQV